MSVFRSEQARLYGSESNGPTTDGGKARSAALEKIQNEPKPSTAMVFDALLPFTEAAAALAVLEETHEAAHRVYRLSVLQPLQFWDRSVDAVTYKTMKLSKLFLCS